MLYFFAPNITQCVCFGERSVLVDKRINIISDSDGGQIVVITDIRFKGKRNINWKEIEQYLKEYIGDCYEVVETADQIFISSDFPGELKGSKDTRRLFGANAKAKANATQGFQCFFSVQQIEDGKKITKENIMLMQNTVGTDLLQDLPFLFMRVILGNLKGLISSG